MIRQSLSIALAASVAAALAGAAACPASAAAPQARRGLNDCAAGNHSCAGQAASYKPAEFKCVTADACTSMKVHGQKGSLTSS